MGQDEKIILGIDPGTSIMGYGIIHKQMQQLKLLQYGVIHLSKYSNHAIKLKKIFERVQSLIDQFNPDELAIESPFFGKNPQSIIKLGRAQGVAMAAALNREIPVNEYSPRSVKQAVTGNGNASKEQVAGMLKHILSFDLTPEFFDATDALAVAVCHIYNYNKLKNTSSGWKNFIKDNPDRVV